MNKLPFLLSHTDWQNVPIPEVDSLLVPTSLSDHEKAVLKYYRKLELRTEWNCRRTVTVNNVLVVLGALFLAINGLAIVNIITTFTHK